MPPLRFMDVKKMQRPVVIGLILLIVGNLFSAFYDVSIKWLPDDANASTFLLVRQISSVFMLLPVWLYSQRPMTTHISVHLWRANIGSVGALFNYWLDGIAARDG